ncbi:hypothetical protein ACFW7P_30565 [Streptomyces albidoflavus]
MNHPLVLLVDDAAHVLAASPEARALVTELLRQVPDWAEAAPHLDRRARLGAAPDLRTRHADWLSSGLSS